MSSRPCLWSLALTIAVPVVATAQPPTIDGTADELAAWLDSEVAAVWDEAGFDPQPIDDATFLRRAYLDLLGTLPSVAVARDFLKDEAKDKRDRLVDDLLVDDRSAEHLARVWRRAIVPPGPTGEAAGSQLDPWLTERLAENTPFDDLAKRLVTGSYEGDQAAATMFRQAAGGGPAETADATSRLFLGVRIGCARCHDHPFTGWKQGDFWGLAAFFGEGGGTGAAMSITAENGRSYNTRFLGEAEDAAIPNGRRPSDVFADWMTSDENPYFSATAVNRVWQQLVGRGLVTPVEDLDLADAEDRQPILDAFASKFADSGFDLRSLVAAICKSRAYQAAGPALSVEVQGVRPLKVLAPEQVFASLEQALMLPISRGDGSPRYNGQRLAFVRRLDESAGRSPEDFQAGVPQALLMMNGRLTSDAVDLDQSRTLRAVVDAPFLDPTQKIETLYLAALTRKPRQDELEVMLRHIESSPAGEPRSRAYAEVFWAILNSPEFVLCR